MPRGQSRKSLFNNKVGSLNIRVLCFLPELHADFMQSNSVRLCKYMFLQAWIEHFIYHHQY